MSGHNLSYAQLCDRLFNRPLLVTPQKARVLLGVMAQRQRAVKFDLYDEGLDRRIGAAELEAMRQEAQAEAQARAQIGREARRLFDFDAESGLAYIPVMGTLVQRNGLDPMSGMTGYDGISTKLAAALADPEVRGILLEIDSPGGEVAGAFDLADEIRAAREIKPVWAIANELAASAGYALASAAGMLFAPRTAFVGSIGVVTMHIDMSKALEDFGLVVTLIHAGAHKVDGNPLEPLPEAVRADIQAELDAVWSLFIDTVAQARGLEAEAVRATEARVFGAEQALSLGLIDGIAPAREVAVTFAEELQGLPAAA